MECWRAGRVGRGRESGVLEGREGRGRESGVLEGREGREG